MRTASDRDSARRPAFADLPLGGMAAVLAVYDLPMSRAARILAAMIFGFLPTFDPGAAPHHRRTPRPSRSRPHNRGVVRGPGECPEMALEPRRNAIPNRSSRKTTLFGPQPSLVMMGDEQTTRSTRYTRSATDSVELAWLI